MADKLKALITSRRFLLSVGGVLAVLLHDAIGLPEDETNRIVALIVAWVVGDSLRRTD